jgi:hypothetical protein
MTPIGLGILASELLCDAIVHMVTQLDGEA